MILRAQIKELNEYDALPTKAGVKLTKDEKQIKQVQTIVAYHKLGPRVSYFLVQLLVELDTSMYQLTK
jgi:hypothetical protein